MIAHGELEGGARLKAPSTEGFERGLFTCNHYCWSLNADSVPGGMGAFHVDIYVDRPVIGSRLSCVDH
jgi:hypothetical protein